MQLIDPGPPSRACGTDPIRQLVEVIAHQMWLRYARNGVLSWAGVERHLARIVDQARRDERDSPGFALSLAAVAISPGHPAERRRATRTANPGALS